MHTLLAVSTILAVSPCVLAADQPSPSDNHERDFLGRIRRLTVEGRPLGRRLLVARWEGLVFQSEREPGNPFYQIYTLDCPRVT